MKFDATSKSRFDILPRFANTSFAYGVLVFFIAGCGPTSQPVPTFQDARVTGASASDPETLAKRYIEAYRHNAERRSQLVCLENRTAFSTDSRVAYDELPGYRNILSEDQTAFTSAFDTAGKQLLAGVVDCEQRENAELDRLIGQWTSFRTKRNQAEIQMAEAEANKRVAGQLATLLNLDNRWFWLAALVAFASLAAVTLHERRHEIRRFVFGARARAMGASLVLQIFFLVLLVTTVVIFVFGNRIYAHLIEAGSGGSLRTLTSMNEEVEELRASSEGLATQVKGLLNELSPLVAQTLDSANAPSEAPAAPTWEHVQASLFSASVQAGVKSRIATGLATDLERLQSLSEEYANSSADVRRFQFLKWLVHLTFGLVFLAAVAASGWMLLTGFKRRKQLTTDTCPLCLGIGRFQVMSDSSLSRRRTVNLLRCTNVVSEQPHEECEFTFLSVYREMTKLCFPTLGHPQAGKTHWLAMLYRELNRGNFKANVQFDKVKSRSSEEFDRTVNDILNARMNPSATQTDRLPHPLIFNFCDNDRLGRSNTLVNIFDYSGEVTTSRTLDDPHRRRALDADGYLFFLDPTYLAEPQADGLVNFREDVRAIRGVRTGHAIRSPVALCVSKIDLLTTQPYAAAGGAGPVDAFYKSLRDIDPTGTDFSLRAIEARSQLVMSLRDTIWPGWQIERQIHDLFGGRFMFFPLTPVGLSELGETDLRLRMIEPFAILEPLAWLLHMNGYPVLK